MPEEENMDEADVRRTLDELTEQALASSPTRPGLYRLPCGECYVDFFITAEGKERWLVPGDEGSHDRKSVATMWHGPYSWERMYTLIDAAEELITRAEAEQQDLAELVMDLIRRRDEETPLVGEE